MTEFQDFYADLYKSKMTHRPHVLNDFLDDIPLPTLKQENSKQLDELITD